MLESESELKSSLGETLQYETEKDLPATGIGIMIFLKLVGEFGLR